MPVPSASSRKTGFWTVVPTNRSDSSFIPIHDSNDDDAASPLQKRSLFQTLQQNSSIPSPNTSEPSLSIESDPSYRSQSTGSAVLENPMAKEFTKVSALLNSKARGSTSSHSSSNPSIEILPPAVHSKLPSESPFAPVALPLDPRRKEFAKVSALLAQASKKPNGTNHDTVNDLPGPEMIESFIESPSNGSFSKTTNDNTISISQSPSNFTSHSFEEVYGLTDSIQPSSLNFESIQPSVTQTSQPCDEDSQHTLETKKHPDLIPITQHSPLPTKNWVERELPPDPVVESVNRIPGEFPLNEDKPSTPPNVPTKLGTEAFPDNNFTPVKDSSPDRKISRKRSVVNPFILALAQSQLVSVEVPKKVEQPKAPWRPGLSSDSDDPLSPDDGFARRMEELGRIRRIESRNRLNQQSKAHPDGTSQWPSQPNVPFRPKLRPQLPVLEEDNSSDVSTLLREAYVERQQSLQAQLDKALAELRDVQAENQQLTNENKRLIDENKSLTDENRRLKKENLSQQHSITQLRTGTQEIRRAQDLASVQIKNQLRDANASLAALNKEKKGWQDKLDLMLHKLTAAERRIRSLDQLTRHKLESRQEAAYGQPKRRGQLATILASTDVIEAMSALNQEIYQTSVQLVEGLARTSIYSTSHKPQAQKVLGDRLTAMMDDQARTKSGFNMLLMQTVLEVFMTHWCSSIIEAFYPSQQSFADLLIELSAQTARTSGK